MGVTEAKTAFSLNGLQQEAAELVDPLKPYVAMRITDQSEIPWPEPLISLHGEIISTAGNITTISGPPKSGKTAVVSAIEAGAISDTGNIDGLPGLSVAANPYGKAVVHLDTEQTAFKQKQNLLSVLKRAGMERCPDHYFSYNLRALDLAEYMSTTAAMCKGAAEVCGGAHLIIIDGLADYISDVNDCDQANAVIKWTEQLAIIHNCPVIIVIHTNPGTGKERGHLGSQAQRKSESVLQVNVEGEISFLEPTFLRNAGKGTIAPIQFAFDSSKGYHIGAAFTVAPLSPKDRMRLEQLRETCTGAIGTTGLSYTQAIDEIMRVTGKGERTAKELFKEAKAHRFIVEIGGKWQANS